MRTTPAAQASLAAACRSRGPQRYTLASESASRRRLGAVVFGAVVMIVGLLAAVVAGVMQVSRWVALGD